MVLITFDFDDARLDRGIDQKAINDNINSLLKSYGFNKLKDYLYLGDDVISEVHATIAIQELTARYDWFYLCAYNIKFLRVSSILDADFIVDKKYREIN